MIYTLKDMDDMLTGGKHDNRKHNVGMSKFFFTSKFFPRISYGVLIFLSFLISNLFPKRKWYNVALKVARYYAGMKWLIKKNRSRAFMRAQVVNTLLALLTRKRKNFPIPYRISGLHHMNHSKGLILCSVHLPLVKVTLRGLLEGNKSIDAAIVGKPTKDGLMAVWGITKKIPTIVNSSYVLLKAKTILKDNGSVVLMIDKGTNKGITRNYSPNIMHLCSKIESKLVFFFAELTPEGVIESYFCEAPFPQCENENAINENLTFLRKTSNQILDRYANQS